MRFEVFRKGPAAERELFCRIHFYSCLPPFGIRGKEGQATAVMSLCFRATPRSSWDRLTHAPLGKGT